MNDLDRISMDPDICSGKPCIKGTRILVSNILGLLASSYSTERIIANYPSITEEDITAALHFAAVRMNEDRPSLRSA